MTEITYGPTLAISEEKHAEKYRLEGESFYEAQNRVADALKDDYPHFLVVREITLDQRFMPAGRIQAAVGSPRKITPFNCYVSGTIKDSFNDIMTKATEAGKTMRLGGGIGYDFSTLRPRGERIASLGSRSSGPVSFMGIYDAICHTIASAGHRRGAQMGVLRVDHPDIEEFIRAKQNDDKLRAFNISVGATDKFMQAVVDDSEFDLVFDGRVYNTIKARPLFNEIMRSTWDWAEPGFLLLDTINRTNNLWYCEEIAATNPCVTADTPILTEGGYFPISNLVGSSVRVWNGHEFSTVKPEVTGVNQEIMEVHLSDGANLECTPYHKFTTTDGDKTARELSVGDKLERCSYPIIDGYASVGTDAYAQGFYSGDGWVKKETGGQYIGLYGEKKELLGRITSRLQPHSTNEYDVVGGYDGTDRNQTKLYLYYGSSHFLPKSYVPNAVVRIQSRLDWLAGLADADGCLAWSGNSASLQITSKDKGFLVEVNRMLQTLGVSGIVSPMKDCFRLSISAWYLSDLIELGFMPSRLNLAVHKRPIRQCQRYITVAKLVQNGRIDSKVYCFNEPKNHTGIFNGVYTRQCGEQPLPPYGACLLGSFNLTKYLKKSGDGFAFDYAKLKADIPPIVRAMDNIHDIAIFPLEEQAAESASKRRMGIGYTGLANAGELCGYKYGSQEFLKWVERVSKVLRDGCYNASIDLAKEKGSFPLYDEEKYLQGEFIQSLPDEIKERIKKYGIRNSHLLSFAPTGTISLTADNVSSGIEPVFAHAYDRTIQTFDGPQIENIKDWAYREHGLKGKTSSECTAEEHLQVLATCTKYVDSAVSKTVNVSPDMPWDDFKELYINAWKLGCKGITTFNPSGKRFGILNVTETEDAEACYIDPTTGDKSCG